MESKKQIHILLKPARVKEAHIIATLEVADGQFDTAADACREYCKTNNLTDTSVKIFWTWTDSAWNRKR